MLRCGLQLQIWPGTACLAALRTLPLLQTPMPSLLPLPAPLLRRTGQVPLELLELLDSNSSRRGRRMPSSPASLSRRGCRARRPRLRRLIPASPPLRQRLLVAAPLDLLAPLFLLALAVLAVLLAPQLVRRARLVAAPSLRLAVLLVLLLVQSVLWSVAPSLRLADRPRLPPLQLQQVAARLGRCRSRARAG